MTHMQATGTTSYSEYSPGQNSQQLTSLVIAERYDEAPIPLFIGQNFLDLESRYLFYWEYMGKLGFTDHHQSKLAQKCT